MNEHAVFAMEAGSAREREAFAVATVADEVARFVAMFHAGDLLLDGGALVELFGGVVRSVSPENAFKALNTIQVKNS